eukprot:3197180-Rhodomonas_salina.3
MTHSTCSMQGFELYGTPHAHAQRHLTVGFFAKTGRTKRKFRPKHSPMSFLNGRRKQEEAGREKTEPRKLQARSFDSVSVFGCTVCGRGATNERDRAR